MPLLPTELIDHIFSFLQGDSSALKACSKTHPSVSRLVERHLYADIVVETNDSLAVSELHEHLAKNSRILNYPRRLKIRVHNSLVLIQEIQSIMAMVPRMTNLTSLKLCGTPSGDTLFVREDFLSTFRNSLQQSSVEQVCLSDLYLPLPMLDECKSIKKLTLSHCVSMIDLELPELPLQFLETLIIRGHDTDVLIWATSRVTNLKSLQLQDMIVHDDWDVFPELLAACSNSLTKLDLDIVDYCQSTYHVGAPWLDDHLTFPFTLSAHRCLEQLSISALVDSSYEDLGIDCALPAIMNFIETAPAIRDVELCLHWKTSNISFLGRFDWSLLVLHQSDFPSICPRIHLRISSESMGRSISPESIFNALAANEVLMDLVKGGLVILKPEWAASF